MRLRDCLNEKTLRAIIEQDNAEIHEFQGDFIVLIEDVKLDAYEHIFSSFEEAMDYVCSL